MKIVRKISQLFHPLRWFLILSSCLLLVFRIVNLLHRGFGEEVWAWDDHYKGLIMLAIATVVFLLAEAMRAGIFSRSEMTDYMERFPFSLVVDLFLLVITLVLFLFKLPTNY